MEPIRPNRSAGDPYSNPELVEYLDSMEGLPDVLGPGETEAERERWAPWQHAGNARFARFGEIVPGLALALAIAGIGSLVAAGFSDGLGFSGAPLSPILVAILLGLAIRNSIGLPPIFEPGLRLSLKRLLRIGVALLGIRLSLAAAGTIGLVGLPIVIGCIATALILVTRIGRAVSLPPRLSTLIAVGTAICGNSAIVALAPTIEATDDEVSYAVGCVTLFGLVALVLHPFLAHTLFDGDPTLVGLFLGTAIHDTAQVAGAGLVYAEQFGSPEALDAATVTKLQRNMFMVAVIPAMAFATRRRRPDAPLSQQLQAAIPLFVFGFIAMSLIRTLGDAGSEPFWGLLGADAWNGLIEATTDLAKLLLTVAMAAVGLGTSFARLRGLGLRPLAVGLAAATLVGGVSYVLVSLIGPYA
ncbi:MAG: putative sulfate exporter family transporter [Myxococcota bacterium]